MSWFNKKKKIDITGRDMTDFYYREEIKRVEYLYKDKLDDISSGLSSWLKVEHDVREYTLFLRCEVDGYHYDNSLIISKVEDIEACYSNLLSQINEKIKECSDEVDKLLKKINLTSDEFELLVSTLRHDRNFELNNYKKK